MLSDQEGIGMERRVKISLLKERYTRLFGYKLKETRVMDDDGQNVYLFVFIKGRDIKDLVVFNDGSLSYIDGMPAQFFINNSIKI